MDERSLETADLGGVAEAAPPQIPSQNALRWLMGLRLVVISTLFLGILLIQVNSQRILPLRNFYGLILFSYGLSLVYLILYARKISPRVQSWIQLLGDIAVVTGFVYFTGGIYSPFSFLYLTVIAVAAILMRGGGLIFAGISAVAYGLLVDLMVFEVLPVPDNLTGIQIAIPASRVLIQLLTNVVGFVLLAVLVSIWASRCAALIAGCRKRPNEQSVSLPSPIMWCARWERALRRPISTAGCSTSTLPAYESLK